MRSWTHETRHATTIARPCTDGWSVLWLQCTWLPVRSRCLLWTRHGSRGGRPCTAAHSHPSGRIEACRPAAGPGRPPARLYAAPQAVYKRGTTGQSLNAVGDNGARALIAAGSSLSTPERPGNTINTHRTGHLLYWTRQCTTEPDRRQPWPQSCYVMLCMRWLSLRVMRGKQRGCRDNGIARQWQAHGRATCLPGAWGIAAQGDTAQPWARPPVAWQSHSS